MGAREAIVLFDRMLEQFGRFRIVIAGISIQVLQAKMVSCPGIKIVCG